MGFIGLLVVLLGVPAVEIWVMVRIGGHIGASWTVLAVFATAIIGVTLVRIQGLATLDRIQTGAREGEVPAVELISGAGLLFAGLMLIIPGFVTDALGFLLLVPPLRIALARAVLLRAVVVRPVPPSHAKTRRGSSIEGESRRIDD